MLLFAVVAPFFTTYLIRTIAWETILSDESPVDERPAGDRARRRSGHILATSGAVIAGLTYNFLPFMVLPLYASLERIDDAADRGGEGPLLLGRARASCG